MYYYIEPEVSGGFGEQTVIDATVHPPKISILHYLFDGWLGDELIESFPCFLVTEKIAKQIEHEGLSGASFDEVFISTSEQFKELYPNRELPSFRWLKITGKAGVDDFGIADDFRLVVSKRSLEILEQGQISNADIEPFE